MSVTRVSISQVPQGTSYGQKSNESLTLQVPIGHPQPQTLFLRTPSHQLRLVVLLLISLPIPPLLSLLYFTAGHAILSQIHTSSSSIYHIPILSSIEAGATGGFILLPIAFTLYFLIIYNKKPVPDDFFDDDSVITGSIRCTTYVGYLVCLLFFVGIGGIAGPLGVTCLSSGNSNALVITKKMLSTGDAAAAGFLGGVVLSIGGLLLSILSVLVWSFWRRKFQLS